MRTFIGLSCVLMLFMVTTGCSAPPADAPAEEAANSAEATTEETAEVVEEAPVEEAEETVVETEVTEEEMPAEEEVVVETFDTEARPSLLLEIMMEPVTDMIESQTSALPLPGLGG